MQIPSYELWPISVLGTYNLIVGSDLAGRMQRSVHESLPHEAQAHVKCFPQRSEQRGGGDIF